MRLAGLGVQLEVEAAAQLLELPVREDGEELISGLGGVEVVWIYKDGRIEYTEGVRDLIVEKS